MTKRIVLAIVILAALLSACGVKATPTPLPGFIDSKSVGVAPQVELPRELAPGVRADDANMAETSGAALQDRLVIQNADLSIVVADPQAKMTAIAEMAKQMGGFVVSSNLYQTYIQSGGTAPEGAITIRVPADKLDAALSQIKANAVEVRNENRSGQDVTDQYVDLQSRLKAKQAAEQKLLQIMEKAEKTEDVLNVFYQLSAVQSDIEVLKGQIKYYEQAAALSAISVTLIAEATIKPIEIGGWKPQGVARDAVQTLINFMQGFVNFLIWLVLFILPMLVLVLLPFFLIFLGIRAVVRKNRARKAAKGSKE